MLWLLGGIAVILAGLLLSPVRIEVRFSHHDKRNDLELYIRYLIFHYTHRVQVKPAKAEGQPSLHVTGGSNIDSTKGSAVTLDKINSHVQRIKNLIKRIEDLLPAVRRVVRSFRVQKFTWKTTLGVQDAPSTALLCGVMWSVKGFTAGLLSKFLRFRKTPNLSVHPEFHDAMFQSELECILTGGLGKAMYTGLRLLWLVKQGGAHARASNSVADANSHGKPEGNG